MKVKKIVLTLLFSIFLIASVMLIVSHEVNIAMFTGLITVVFGFMLIQTMRLTSNPTNAFNGTVNNILKTYDVILVEVDNLPDISERKVINTTGFKDMVNIEYEYRKPVYYVHNEDSYDFLILTESEVYVYTLKKEETTVSIFEAYMNYKANNQNSSDKQIDVLDSLENTTVIKIDDDKEYVVSPIKNN